MFEMARTSHHGRTSSGSINTLYIQDAGSRIGNFKIEFKLLSLPYHPEVVLLRLKFNRRL
jgi:hypothetical protein